MPTRRWLTLLAIALACVLGGILLHPKPPVYSGKTAAQWFEEPDVRNRADGGLTPGIQAFLELRGDAVPFLTRVALKGPNWGSSRYAIVYSGLPAEMQRFLPQARADSEYRERQGRAFWLLGNLAYWERHPSRTWGKSRAPLPYEEIRQCIREGLGDVSWIVRINACESAGILGDAAAPLVPELIGLLGETSENVRLAAIKALGDIGPQAAKAVPRLASLMPGAREHEMWAIVRALGRIGTAAKPAAPLLVLVLTHDRTELQRDTAFALAQIGCVPEEGRPVLQKLARTEKDPQLSQAAALALWSTAPTDPLLIGALSNAVRQDPLTGLELLHRLASLPMATNLAPMVRSFAPHQEFPAGNPAGK